MWGLLYCCVTLAIANPLWVQALPTNITFDNIDTNHVDIKPPECPENEFFNHEGKACGLSCEFPTPSHRCKEEKGDTCQCNEGYVRNGTGVCITLVQCYESFQLLYDLEYNASKPTSQKMNVEEFTSTLDKVQSTNKTDDTSITTYDDIDEYGESRETRSPLRPLANDESGVVVNYVLDRQLQEKILVILHEIYAPRYDAEESVNSEYNQEYLNKLLRNKVKEELDSYINVDYYGDDSVSF